MQGCPLQCGPLPEFIGGSDRCLGGGFHGVDGELSVRNMGADEGAEDSLNHKFPGGDQIGVEGILGPEEGGALLDQIPLERDIAVDECRDDVPVSRLRMFQNHDIAVEDTGTDHRIPPHLQGECPGIARKADRPGINRDAAINLLLLTLGNASRDHSVEGNLQKLGTGGEILQNDVAGTTGFPANDPLLFQKIEMAGHGGRRAEPESGHDLPH